MVKNGCYRKEKGSVLVRKLNLIDETGEIPKYYLIFLCTDITLDIEWKMRVAISLANKSLSTLRGLA